MRFYTCRLFKKPNQTPGSMIRSITSRGLALDRGQPCPTPNSPSTAKKQLHLPLNDRWETKTPSPALPHRLPGAHHTGAWACGMGLTEGQRFCNVLAEATKVLPPPVSLCGYRHVGVHTHMCMCVCMRGRQIYIPTWLSL